MQVLWALRCWPPPSTNGASQGQLARPEAVLYVSAYLLSRGKRAVLGEKTE